MKKRFSNEKGVTMLTVTLTVVVLIVILSVVTFYVSNSIHMEQFQNMRADIREIESKALTYYVEKGVLPVYSGDADSKKTKNDMGEGFEPLNPNDGDEYAKVNLNLLGIVPAYDTEYYINTESFTVYVKDAISINSMKYFRPVEKFDKIALNGSFIPEWEKECYDSIDVISKMFKYDSDGFITGIDTNYCSNNSNPEYYSDSTNWTKMVIPAVQPSGEPVKGIAQNAFSNVSINNGTLKIPKTIELLPDGCLNGKSIKYLYCDAGNISITAFSGCSSIEEIHLGPNVLMPDGSESENTGLFRNMTNVKKVWIDGDSIGKYAFAGCSNMQMIVLNNNLKGISDYAFYNCVNNQITILVDTAATNLDSSYWPAGGSYTTGTISFPDKLEKIGTSAFYNDRGMSGIVDFTTCTSLTQISAKAFFGTSITSVKINSTVTYDSTSFPSTATIRN